MNASYYREPSVPAVGARGRRPRAHRGDVAVGVGAVLVGLLATPEALLGLEAWGAQASLGATLVMLGLAELVAARGERHREEGP